MVIDFALQNSLPALKVQTVAPFEKVLQLLADFGFFRVVLPFLLIFAIVYAILVKTKVLGDIKESNVAKSASAIIALVVAFLVVMYTPVIDALAIVLPQSGFVLVMIVLFLMVLAMFGITFEPEAGEKFPPWAIAIFIVVLVLFLAIVGFAAPQIEPLHTFALFLMGQIPIELTEEVIGYLIATIILLTIVIGVWVIMRKSA